MRRAQLLALGVREGAIQHRARTRELVVVHAGVYGVGHAERTPVALAHAAVLACGSDAVLSYDSAGALWGVRRWPPKPEVSAPETRRRPGIRTWRCTTLGPEDITNHYGMRVTTIVRTIIDIAPRLNDRELIRVIQDARHAYHLTPSRVHELLLRCPRTQRLVDPTQNPTRSPLEDDFLAWIKRHRLPTPQVNVTVNGKEVDALFEAERVIVELDSWAFHDDPFSFRNDRRRDRGSAAKGFLTVRLIKEDLRDEDAEALHQTLRQRRP